LILRLIPAGLLVLLPFLLAGCGEGGLRSTATPAQLAACRARADAVYDRQNRADLFRADTLAGNRDAPFSGSGVIGAGSETLSNRFARERLIDRCLAGNQTRTDNVDPLAQTPTKPPTPTKPSTQP
jgi:hypothetical protein